MHDRKGGTMSRSPYRSSRDLKADQFPHQFALPIHDTTKRDPVEEKYNLPDQIRRTSISVPAILRESWKMRKYEKTFVSKVIDTAGEAGVTEVWLGFSNNLNTLSILGILS